MIVLVVSMLLLLVFGVPIGYAIGISTLLYVVIISDMSPLVVVLSLFFWGWVLGPVGILLSIPLTMMVKDILLESGDDARWLADLMGQGEIPDREPATGA